MAWSQELVGGQGVAQDADLGFDPLSDGAALDVFGQRHHVVDTAFGLEEGHVDGRYFDRDVFGRFTSALPSPDTSEQEEDAGGE